MRLSGLGCFYPGVRPLQRWDDNDDFSAMYLSLPLVLVRVGGRTMSSGYDWGVSNLSILQKAAMNLHPGSSWPYQCFGWKVDLRRG